MRRLGVFNQVSLDGYFTDKNGDMSWAHKQDAEWQAFASQNASGGGVLVFGRITYDMMASYWPTPEAHKQNPVVAEHPIVLGSGRTMFDGMDGKMGLALKNSRSFSNGNVVLWYGPSA